MCGTTTVVLLFYNWIHYSLSWWCAVFCPVSVILFSQLHSQKSSNWHTSRQKKGAYCCYIKLRKRETRIAFSVQKARIAASTILCREYAGSHRLSFKDLVCLYKYLTFLMIGRMTAVFTTFAILSNCSVYHRWHLIFVLWPCKSN